MVDAQGTLPLNWLRVL